MKKETQQIIWELFIMMLIIISYFAVKREYAIIILFAAVIVGLNLYLVNKVSSLHHTVILLSALLIISLKPVFQNYMLIIPPVIVGLLMLFPGNAMKKGEEESLFSFTPIIIGGMNYPIFAASMPFIVASPFIENELISNEPTIISRTVRALLYSSVYSIMPMYSLLVLLGFLLRNLHKKTGIYFDILLRLVVIGGLVH